ncbi:MAG: FtsQ-type POTRA domain-containing protein [Proteobacteria bacterium]|nr:FtsQ-type POTRA domain-containing protein [Pseudomonadota bacterium]
MRRVILAPLPELGAIRPAEARVLWRRARRGAELTLLAALIALPTAAFESGLLARAGGEAWRTALALGAESGLKVSEIVIEGRERMPLTELAGALGVGWGESILAFDPRAARERIEALSWVREAEVSRWFPGTVRLRIVERVPFALWQHQGRFAVIDREGAVILDDAGGPGALAPYAGLPLVVGEGAATAAADALALVAAFPSLAPRVSAMVRVGDRRWNLRFDTGVDVLLPEEDARGALARLAGLEARHGLLERRIDRVDMRLPDRLVVHATPAET